MFIFQIFAKSSTTRLFTDNIYMSFARGYRDMTLKDKFISPRSMHTSMPLFINLEGEHWVVYQYIHYCHLPAWFLMQIVRGICCCMKYKLSGDIQRDVAKLQYNYPFLAYRLHFCKIYLNHLKPYYVVLWKAKPLPFPFPFIEIVTST